MGTKEETCGSSGDGTVYVFIYIYIKKYINIQQQSDTATDVFYNKQFKQLVIKGNCMDNLYG